MLSWLRSAVFGPFGTKRYNTIGLRGDLDEVELVVDVERSFKIDITAKEAQTVLTMGDLEAMIRRKLGRRVPEDAWEELVRIARRHSRSQDGIDRATTFFKAHAKPREVGNG
ncbi:MAG: hypothetical protein QNJ13_05985 [Paracoccaceae bacterium]|nr:hypothetical protein [Paracoccaceae bacterium]